MKEGLKLISDLLMPEMIRLVPDDGKWTLMLDGTVRKKDSNVFIVIAAVPHQGSKLSIIPLIATFIPSENVEDVLQLLYDLKPRFNSQPKSVICDFRPGLLDAIKKIFPSTIIHGCQYHLLEMIAKILIYPKISAIKKKLNKLTNGLVRWAQHCIHRKRSENLTILARSIKKICSSGSGNFGQNFLELCKKLLEIGEWVYKRQGVFQSDKHYRDLVKLFSKNTSWKDVSLLLSQLEFLLGEFTKLRKSLTMQEYKTSLPSSDNKLGSLHDFDQLISNWIVLSKKETFGFGELFQKSLSKLKNHYRLIVPSLRDSSLPRTTSLLESLFSQVKHVLRRWSGTQRVLEPFKWVGSLVTISQSLKKTELFSQMLREITVYDWIEKSANLARATLQYRLQIKLSNSIAKSPANGFIHFFDNLAMREIIS